MTELHGLRTHSGKQPPVEMPPASLPDLIKKLTAEGLIDASASKPAPSGHIEEPGTHPLKVPHLALTPATLKQYVHHIRKCWNVFIWSDTL